MMKKTVSAAALILSAAMLLGSCSGNTSERSDALIESVINDPAFQTSQQPKAAAPAPAAATAAGDEVSGASDETYDPVNIDLTTMTSTMIYSVIYDIMVNTDNYYGKSILLDGYFDTSYDERLDTRYYFIVVPDAAACCMQGLEFKLDDSKVYPDDYPEVRDDIRIRGTLEKYEEEGLEYTYIRTDHIEIGS